MVKENEVLYVVPQDRKPNYAEFSVQVERQEVSIPEESLSPAQAWLRLFF